MKHFILCLFLLSTTVQAQNCIRELDGGGCIVEEKGKYGVMRKGKHIVPAYFDQLNDHTGKYFSVEQNGKWGVFTREGKLILPVAYNKVKMIDAYNGIMTAEGNGYNNVVVSEKIVIAPGAVKASPFLTVSANEVSVEEYLLFMQEMKNNPPADFTYAMAVPDTAAMASNVKKIYLAFTNDAENKCQKSRSVFYFKTAITLTTPCSVMDDKTLKSYLRMPITGISHKQAQRYCLWLADLINESSTADLIYEMNVRLPKPMEWEEIAHAGMSQEMSVNNCIDSMNAKKCILLNYKFDKNTCANTEEQLKLFGNNVVPTGSYNPDYIGVYSIFGNVAEMTSEEGICKGGSYTHFAKQCATNISLQYHKPEPWLGFRWVIEYRLKKK